jgi:hypothetical protein
MLSIYDYKIITFLMFARLYITHNIGIKDGLLIPNKICRNISGAKYTYMKVCNLLRKIRGEYKFKNIDIHVCLYKKIMLII